MPLNFIAQKQQENEEVKEDVKKEDNNDTQLKVLRSGVDNLRER